MTRFTTLIGAALIVMAGPAPASVSLQTALNDYVAEFDYSKLTKADRRELRDVLTENLGHGKTLLQVHSILKDAGALEHLDMHRGAIPTLSTNSH